MWFRSCKCIYYITHIQTISFSCINVFCFARMLKIFSFPPPNPFCSLVFLTLSRVMQPNYHWLAPRTHCQQNGFTFHLPGAHIIHSCIKTSTNNDPSTLGENVCTIFKLNYRDGIWHDICVSVNKIIFYYYS